MHWAKHGILKTKGGCSLWQSFATQEWCDLYKEEINKSAAYEEAAKTWEGDFYFISEAGGPVKEPIICTWIFIMEMPGLRNRNRPQ